MKTYAIIPARSGSKQLKGKNIRPLNGRPLLDYSISFARQLGVDRVLCSTDSEHYAEIAKECGAEVPFLRSAWAAADDAMEHHILEDLHDKFLEHEMEIPDLLVWLRPTFVFRDRKAVLHALDVLERDPSYTSARIIVEAEARLYKISAENTLEPAFETGGKSMIRRQDMGRHYRVYNTDIIRFSKDNQGEDFLGDRVYPIAVEKTCGLDIDDDTDFKIVESLVTHARDLVDEYLW